MRLIWSCLDGFSGNSVGSGSSGAAYFYHAGELTSAAHSEMGVGRFGGLDGQWKLWSSVLLPCR